jgi:hypothetical protein
VDNGSHWMYQALAVYHGFGESNVQLIVVVEMSECFAAVAEGGEPVVSTRQWTMFHAQLLESINQLTA